MTTAELMEEIRQRAKLLPVEERRIIALELLDEAGGPSDDEPGFSDAFVAAMDRRVAEIDSGDAKAKPADEVFASIRARFGW